MRIKLLFIFFGLFFSLFSQPGKEAWHWRFGNKCGINFSTGVPIQETGIPSTWPSPAGCTSVSDPNSGQYLFSLNGTKVFNKNNVPMYNGYNMLGDLNATQQLIVPHPDSSGIYFVFTVSKGSLPNNGVHFSKVDMARQAGLGEVAVKNQVLTPSPTTEKITAVRHCNGKDYWIITHPANSNQFNAYYLSSAGLSTIPVVSNAGVVHQDSIIWSNNTYFEAGGYLKASPNGKKLASGIASYIIPVLEIFDFDNSTGIVSNPITVTYNIPNIVGPYSLSFSPDNSKLYSVPYTLSGDSSLIYQYDLSSGVPSTIITSETLIALVTSPTTPVNDIEALQIAPDGKIYVGRNINDTLAVIANPNAAALSCGFMLNSGLVLTGTSTRSGLPNFIDANYAGIQMHIPDVQQCNTFTTTTLDAGPGFTNYYWSTGATTQTVSINSPGKYWVTVTSPYGCTRTDTINAYIIVGEKTDTLACDTFHANIMQSGVLQYTWFDANNNPVRDFTHSGIYYADINYVAGCAVRDSFNVTVVPRPQIDIGADTTFCKGNLSADAMCSTCTYTWSTGETTSTITIKSPNTYWIHVRDANGCTDSDTLIVRPQLSLFDFVMPNIVTPNNDLLNDEIDFSKYQLSELQLQIYNRWGQKIYEANEPDAKWKPSVDDGTYFYTAQYKIDCGVETKTEQIKGYITVVR